MSNANQQPNRHETAVATSRSEYFGEVVLTCDPLPNDQQLGYIERRLKNSNGSGIFRAAAAVIKKQALVVSYASRAPYPEAAMANGIGELYTAVSELDIHAEYLHAALRPEPPSLPLPPEYNASQAGQELYNQFDEMHREAVTGDIIRLVSQHL